jgi:NAD(P)-dependent dehydrogenase (short-subunit alcohol dehydrogenase family)
LLFPKNKNPKLLFMNFDFKDKTALITGAGSGLGRATALLFAKNNANVMVSDVNIMGGDETVNLIRNQGGIAKFIACNVTIEKEVNSLVENTAKEFGQIDFAVNNAGIGGKWLPTHKYPTDNFREVIEVNTMGVFYCMRAELNLMLKQGFGSIVNVASVAGLNGFPNNLAYDASKHAVVGLTKTAGLEYAKQGIRVNAVCPVFTITPMVKQIFTLDATMEEKLQNSIPMKRYGKAEEVADTIVYLCSDAASFITAHAMPIDGGMTAG